MNENIVLFQSSFQCVPSRSSNQQKSALVQVITWTNLHQDFLHQMISQGHTELIYCIAGEYFLYYSIRNSEALQYNVLHYCNINTIFFQPRNG